jgi:hypothetical protein
VACIGVARRADGRFIEAAYSWRRTHAPATDGKLTPVDLSPDGLAACQGVNIALAMRELPPGMRS